MTARLSRNVLPAIVALTFWTGSAFAAGAPAKGMLEEPARYGVYYDRYEPTFYTGFAPRVRDPRRIQMRIGRGNQLRVTAVLGGADLENYAQDLVARQQTYRALVNSGRVKLTQNRGLEEFERTLAETKVTDVAAAEAEGRDSRVLERNLELMEKLNPGRVFRMQFEVEELLDQWATHVVAEDAVKMTPQRQAELLGLMLPTRLHVLDVDAATAAELDRLVDLCIEGRGGSLREARDEFRALLGRVSHGIYHFDEDDEGHFVEFTAVYPIGTLNDTVAVKGKRIPLYPITGRRALVVHQRTRVIDHIPDEMSYSYSPWIPYIHIGKRMHDALHTLFWQMKTQATAFLPADWKSVKNPDGKPYEHLWLLSRGPMSHGCTHVNAGHQAELRQILPAEEETLDQVELFLDRSENYDVYDIDGDLEPEVMGVRYWIAFSLKPGDKPDALRAPNRRCAYYDWLYAGDLACRENAESRFASIRAGAFEGRKAVAGREYRDIPLYEAAYEPEKVQFYKHIDIPFARELRRVGADRPFPGLEGAIEAQHSENRGQTPN